MSDIVSGDSASPLSGKYLMAFHSCDPSATDCFNPRNHQTYIAQSDDGETWVPVSNYTPYFGSVPDLIRRDNTLYIYNPGTVRRYQIETDTWESPTQVRITSENGNQEMFVDPSAILDSEGNIALFYLVGQKGSDPARCPPGETSCTKIFRSATEVAGSDGTSFIVDPGSRAEIPITDSETASDPDIFTDPSGFIMYISNGAGIIALSSPDLRGTYTPVPGLVNGVLTTGSGGVSSGYYNEETGEYWIYVHSSGMNMISEIRRAVQSTLGTKIPDSSFKTIITGSSFQGLNSGSRVESPGFAVNGE